MASYMTGKHANLNSVIQFLSLFYKHMKNKKLFTVYDDNIFPFFHEFYLFSIQNFRIFLNLGSLQRMSHMTEHVSEAGKVDPG